MIKVEMHFLPDIYVPCDVCHGKRYNRETLEVQYKGKNIHDILGMTVEQAREFFDAVPVVARKLQTLVDVGLSYITLGQSATTLSGGEAQRVKLALELSKRDTGRTLYILDEPTTGLHFQDIEMLLSVLQRLAATATPSSSSSTTSTSSRPPTGSSTSAPRAAAAAADPGCRPAGNRGETQNQPYWPLPQTATGKIGMSHEPPKSAIDEFKGKQGLTRLINALGYSKDGLSAAWKNEAAFREEVLLAAVFHSPSTSARPASSAPCSPAASCSS
jgi:hypothetical protein